MYESLLQICKSIYKQTNKYATFLWGNLPVDFKTMPYFMGCPKLIIDSFTEKGTEKIVPLGYFQIFFLEEEKNIKNHSLTHKTCIVCIDFFLPDWNEYQ